MCGYTSLNPPPISTTTIQEPTRDPNNPFPWTTTNDAGTVIACESSALSEMNVAASVHLTFTTCAGESTTISTPTPTADCRFWDEGWGWSFQVYNIKNWDTGDKDVNDRLRDEEGGCGALTGWEFGEHPEGAEAWFNLPFFIKEGCVERAIKSAGGPKLACDPSGLGKRAFDDGSTSQPKQRRAGTNPAPNLDDPEIAEAYNPTGIDLAKIEHSYQAPNWKRSRRDLKARGIIVSSDVRKRGARPNSPPNLDDPDVAAAYQPSGIDLDGIDHSYTPAQWDNKYKRGRIVKRGCFPSKIRPVSPAPGSPVTTPLPPALCDPILPGVDECNEQIQVRGNVGPKISLFYTG